MDTSFAAGIFESILNGEMSDITNERSVADENEILSGGAGAAGGRDARTRAAGPK